MHRTVGHKAVAFPTAVASRGGTVVIPIRRYYHQNWPSNSVGLYGTFETSCLRSCFPMLCVISLLVGHRRIKFHVLAVSSSSARTQCTEKNRKEKCWVSSVESWTVTKTGGLKFKLAVVATAPESIIWERYHRSFRPWLGYHGMCIAIPAGSQCGVLHGAPIR